jgi:hypothetical protein
MSFSNGNCVETVRSGDNYYILDAKDRSKGPVDIIPAAEYDQRHEVAQLTGSPTTMFGEPEVAEHFSDGELQAYGAYIAAGRVALLTEGEIVTAHENPDLWDFPAPNHALEGLSVSQI